MVHQTVNEQKLSSFMPIDTWNNLLHAFFASTASVTHNNHINQQVYTRWRKHLGNKGPKSYSIAFASTALLYSRISKLSKILESVKLPTNCKSAHENTKLPNKICYWALIINSQLGKPPPERLSISNVLSTQQERR